MWGTGTGPTMTASSPSIVALPRLTARRLPDGTLSLALNNDPTPPANVMARWAAAHPRAQTLRSPTYAAHEVTRSSASGVCSRAMPPLTVSRAASPPRWPTHDASAPSRLLISQANRRCITRGPLLGVVTGGSSLVALRLVWLSARLVGDFASIIAGCITVGWILGEVILFKESVAGFLNVPLQVIYFVTGLVVLGLAGWLWLTDWERAHRQESRHHHGVA